MSLVSRLWNWAVVGLQACRFAVNTFIPLPELRNKLYNTFIKYIFV